VADRAPDNGLLENPEVVAAFESLWAIERLVSGRLITRQLRLNPRRDREIAKYGPEGAVRLCAARAIFTWMLPIGVAALALALVGNDRASGVLFAVLGLAFLLMLLRNLRAAASARRWRRRT
jgi:hypothetical protein